MSNRVEADLMVGEIAFMVDLDCTKRGPGFDSDWKGLAVDWVLMGISIPDALIELLDAELIRWWAVGQAEWFGL